MNRIRHSLFVGQFISIMEIMNLFIIPYLIILYFLDMPVYDIIICILVYIFFIFFIVTYQIIHIKCKKVDINKFESIFENIVYKEKNVKMNEEDIVAFFNSLPIDLLNKIRKDKLKIYFRNRKKKEMKKQINGFYKVSSNYIVVYLIDNIFSFRTFLHEFSHYIDYSFGRISNSMAFRDYLIKFRYSEYLSVENKMIVSSLKLGEPLIKGLNRGKIKQKIQRLVYYMFSIKVFSNIFYIPYGLKNCIELFPELFCNNVKNGGSSFLAIPKNYYNLIFCEYDKYGETEKLIKMFEDIIFMKKWKYPKLNVKK